MHAYSTTVVAFSLSPSIKSKTAKVRSSKIDADVLRHGKQRLFPRTLHSAGTGQ